jgi:hypothetical protein
MSVGQWRMAVEAAGVGEVAVDETEFGRYVELGRENARIIDLAAQHCLRMRFTESGGQGVAEEWTGLPLNSRRVECPVAIGNISGMRLDHVALEFYTEHCQGCGLRQPTGRLPNLQTEYDARQQAARAEDAIRAERTRELARAHAHRLERRRGLRATADPAVSALLDDLDIIDKHPEADEDPKIEHGARRRITAVASRAGDRFTAEVVDELFDVVTTAGATDLLEPLRHLTARRPEFAPRLVQAALKVLSRGADLEAGRCLTDHRSLIVAELVTESLVRSLIVLAGSKTPDEDRFSGPTPVVSANDPAPLRVAVAVAPKTVSSTLRAMLPRPQVAGLVVPQSQRPPRLGERLSASWTATSTSPSICCPTSLCRWRFLPRSPTIQGPWARRSGHLAECWYAGRRM